MTASIFNKTNAEPIPPPTPNGIQDSPPANKEASSSNDDTSSTHGWTDPDDPSIPYNWPSHKKWTVTLIALLGTLIVPWNGTSITVAAREINSDFNVSDDPFPNSYWAVTSWSLGGAVFIIFFLPLLEDFGVRTGHLVSYVVFLLFIIPQALARNFATLVVTRFISGGCVALIANTCASIIPDLWRDERATSLPISLYIFCYIAGSTLGPPLFAGVMQNIGDWRWIFYIQLIIYGACLPIFAIFLRETRANVILRKRQKATHPESASKSPTTPPNEPKTSLLRRLAKSSSRPLYLLLTEPLLFAATLWSAFAFGLVFFFTQSVEQVYAGLYGWSAYSTGYIQFSIVIGEFLGFLTCLLQHRLFFFPSSTRNPENPGHPIPEARVYTSVFASFIGMTGGMFVYAWTSYPEIPWIAPTVGLAMVGFGVQVVITAASDYVVDAYGASGYAGSAISAVAAMENVTAGLLPLATKAIYERLGFRWASTLIGFLALGLSFAPVLFVWRGRGFRERSPFMRAGRA